MDTTDTQTPDNVIPLDRAPGAPGACGADAQAPATPAAPTPQRQPIDPNKMREIIGAYARLKQIGSATIINPRDEAEQKGLVQYLHNELLANAEELFGCWVAIQQEYTPLITAVGAILARASRRAE